MVYENIIGKIFIKAFIMKDFEHFEIEIEKKLYLKELINKKTKLNVI